MLTCLEATHVNLATHGDIRCSIMTMKTYFKSVDLLGKPLAQSSYPESEGFLMRNKMSSDMSYKIGFTGTTAISSLWGKNQPEDRPYPYGTLC